MSAVTCLSPNVYVEYFGPTVIPKRRARIAKAVSLVAKLGAVLFVFGLHDQAAINLQLLGALEAPDKPRGAFLQ